VFGGALSGSALTAVGVWNFVSLKVVDDDAHMVHPLNRHGRSPSSPGALSWPLRT
jgi:hypothetical protein